MALTFYWRCESATFDGTHDYSAGDTTPTETGTLSYNSTQVFAGVNAAQFDAFENALFSSASILDGAEGAFAAAFYVTAWNNLGELFIFWDANVNQDRIELVTLGTSGSGNVRLRISEQGVGATNIDTTGLNLSQNTWYFIKAHWDEASTTGRVEVFNSFGVSLGSAQNTSVSPWPTAANMDEFLIGDVGNGTEGWFDNVMAADAYAEPLEDYFSIVSYVGYGVGLTPGITKWVNFDNTPLDGGYDYTLGGTEYPESEVIVSTGGESPAPTLEDNGGGDYSLKFNHWSSEYSLFNSNAVLSGSGFRVLVVVELPTAVNNIRVLYTVTAGSYAMASALYTSDRIRTTLNGSGWDFEAFAAFYPTDATKFCVELRFDPSESSNLDKFRTRAWNAGSSVPSFVSASGGLGTALAATADWTLLRLGDGGNGGQHEYFKVIVSNDPDEDLSAYEDVENYPGGPVVFEITSVTPSDVHDGQTGVVIAGTGFGATEGEVRIGGRLQTVTNWTDTSITFTAERQQDAVGAANLTVKKYLV